MQYLFHKEFLPLMIFTGSSSLHTKLSVFYRRRKYIIEELHHLFAFYILVELTLLKGSSTQGKSPIKEAAFQRLTKKYIYID